MRALFVVVLVAHVFAAIMFVGGATIAASLFPRYLGWHWSNQADGVNPAGDPPRGQEQVLRALARVTRNYGTGALLVPLLGLVLAYLHDRLGEAWLSVSLLLAAVAAYLLIVVVRGQDDQLRAVRADRDGSGAGTGTGTGGDPAGRERGLRRTGLATVSFNLVWLTILVLMVWRPGGHG